MEPNIISIIGDGRATKLWLDRWHYEGVLVRKYGENVRHLSGMSRVCNVDQILANGEWFLGPTTTPILVEVWNMIPQIEKLPVDCVDKTIWTTSPNERF